MKTVYTLTAVFSNATQGIPFNFEFASYEMAERFAQMWNAIYYTIT